MPNDIVSNIVEEINVQSQSGETYRQDADDRRKAAQTDRYQSDTKDRQWLAKWSAMVVSVWLWFVLLILLHNTNRVKLSDNVMMTLLGTTTLNVLGLMFIVLRGHFVHAEK